MNHYQKAFSNFIFENMEIRLFKYIHKRLQMSFMNVFILPIELKLSLDLVDKK